MINLSFFSLAIGVRDYIHVVDLASGHVCALKKLHEDCGFKVCVYFCYFISLGRPLLFAL